MIRNITTHYNMSPAPVPDEGLYRSSRTQPENASYRHLTDKEYAEQQSNNSTWLGSLLGKVWNGVNTLVGLGWGFIGWLGGADITFGNNAIQFENHPLTFSAITLGNTISYSADMGPDDPRPESRYFSVGTHERQHTYQGELLGPFYLLSNLAGGLLASIFQFDWHGSLNWNERGPQSTPPRPW